MAYATKSLSLATASSQYVSIGDSALLEPGGSCTVEVWVKMSGVIGGGANAYIIASKGTSTGNIREFVLKVTNDGSDNLSLVTQTSSAGSSYNGGTSVAWTGSPQNGVWYHVAWVMNGSTEQFFVNGVQMGASQTSAISSIFNGSGAFGWGAENISGTPGTFWNGNLSLGRFWQTARTAAQILANKCSVLGATTSLSGEWSFDNVYTDDSGNALTLTSHGSPTFATDVTASCVNNYILSTVTETLTESDVLSKVWGATLSDIEQINLSEVFTPISTFAKSIVEQLSLSDSVTADNLILISISEQIGLSDSESNVVGYAIVATDQANLSDVATAFAGYTITVLDQISTADAAMIAYQLGLLIQETLNLSDVLDLIKSGWSFKTKRTSVWSFSGKNSSSWTFKDKHESQG